MQLGRLNGILGRLAIVACAIAGLGFIPASYAPPFDPVVNLAHMFAAVFLALLVAVLAFWRSIFAVVMALLALAGPTILVAPETIAALTEERQTAAGKPYLKVIATNVWTDNIKFEAFTHLIEAEQPDIVFLQESSGPGWRIILDRLAPRYRIVAGLNWPHEANAVILTRLEQAAESDPYVSSHVTARLRLPDELGGGVFEAASIHLSRPPPIEPQLEETGEIVEDAARFNDRAIMGGDFNATPWSGTIRRLDSSLPLRRITRLIPSWPAAMPIAPVDHIYVGRAWVVSDVRLGPNIGSDHRPVIATLVMRSEGERATSP